MTDLNNFGNLFSGVRFWLPMVTAFMLVVKGFLSIKASIAGWMDTLLNNHLSHIESATVNTHTETQKTNALLVASAAQDVQVAAKVAEVKTVVEEHQKKEELVWQGIVNTLVILEDRTRQTIRHSPRRR
jgi:hypothetical protein